MPDLVQPTFPPQAYIIGAQKAGTSTLALLLAQHPAINIARGKEVHFYSGHWEKGVEWYQAQFAPKPGASILLDASTSYAMAPLGHLASTKNIFSPDLLQIPERMKLLRPDARLIYILRDPVDRMYSSYWQAVRAGYETRPLEIAVQEEPEYVSGSLYFAQLQHFLRYFARDAILLLKFRELTRDPHSVARSCLRFLDAEPYEFDFPDTRPRNIGFQYNALGSTLLKTAGSEKNLAKIVGTVRRMMPRRVYDALSRLASKPLEKMDSRIRAQLEPYVAEDSERLSKFAGISFD